MTGLTASFVASIKRKRSLIINDHRMTTTTHTLAQTQALSFSRLKQYEHQLDDVMELTDNSILKTKLATVEKEYAENADDLNTARLGIIYHETALNLSFLSKTTFKGYAKKSFDILSSLFHSATTEPELLPFVASYHASALSLVSAETNKLSFLNEAFRLFADAIAKYAAVSYLPEFLRGSVAENLPWFLFAKKRFAKKDFQNIICKQEKNESYATDKVMSFTYWAWAKQRQSRKHRKQALTYLEKAIFLDPNYTGGRQRAEELKAKLVKAEQTKKMAGALDSGTSVWEAIDYF